VNAVCDETKAREDEGKSRSRQCEQTVLYKSRREVEFENRLPRNSQRLALVLGFDRDQERVEK